MGRVAILFILVVFFFFIEGEAGRLEAVMVKPNRSIIFGQVQKIEKDFPWVTLTVRIIRSYTVEEYANLIEEKEIIQIQPNYTGKEFNIASFFENGRNLNNLQAYYFLVGDYFFAEVSLLGNETRRKVLYFTIQRVNEESVLKKERRPREFLGGDDEAG